MNCASTSNAPTCGSAAAARRSTRCWQVLEDERALHTGAWWFGPQLGHADIAVGVVLRFIADAHPGLIDKTAYPALSDLAARFEALPVAREISQAFTPSA
jgi:glutathione S-transferase